MDSGTVNEEHKVLHNAMNIIEIEKTREIQKYYLTETLKLSIVTSPLYCISSSFQFINKNLYSKVKTNGIRIQIFKPSFYLTYRETITNLTKQSILGLYKGNFYRMSFFILSNNLKQKLDYQYFRHFKINKIVKEMFLYSIVDIFLNPLLFIESRYIIQNRKKNYRIYNNLFEIIRHSYKDLWKGSLVNIPRNIFFIIGLNSYYMFPGTPGAYTNYFAIALAHILSYPFLTLQRNIYYHTSNTNSNHFTKNKLYEREFRGVVDGLKYFYREFGVFSLYRGITPYLLAIALWHYYVPNAAKGKFYRNIFADEKQSGPLNLDLDDEDDEEDIQTHNKR